MKTFALTLMNTNIFRNFKNYEVTIGYQEEGIVRTIALLKVIF